jgi:polyferredoxin
MINSEDNKSKSEIWNELEETLEDTSEFAKNNIESRILQIEFKILEHESHLNSLIKEQELISKTKPLAKNWLYLIIFSVIVVVTGFIVVYGWAEKPTVSITYNVGDVISGLLVGISAVLASIFYVHSKDSRDQ